MENRKPQEIIAELDKYVIGQTAAKRALAVALRNRYRRRQLPEDVRREITPKNMMMIGPTGVGKTELARRVARMIEAPFVKVEATKFTEVGYVGRDAESIVHEVVETSVAMVHQEKLRQVQDKAEGLAAERIVGYLCEQSTSSRRKASKAQAGPALQASAVGQGGQVQVLAEAPREESSAATSAHRRARAPSRQLRQRFAELLAGKQLEDTLIEIELSNDGAYMTLIEFAAGVASDESGEDFGEFTQPLSGYPQKRIRRVSVREARRLLTREEANKLIDFGEVVDAAVERAEQSAVVFIDEIDKIVGPRVEIGADVSRQGVQRDLLPIVDGSSVMTRYGPVKTDHMLFIAAGAFHQNKPSDLIPELQGRFPLRVELTSLGIADLERILVDPENALTKQYAALLGTEGVTLTFTPEGIRRIAEIAQALNERMENIGARRLQTVMERILEDISFTASEHLGEAVTVDSAYIDQRLGDLVRDEDLSKYIL